MTRNRTREWNIKRPVKAYIQILPMWVDRKNVLSKINNDLRDFNHIQGKTTKTRLTKGNNYLVVIDSGRDETHHVCCYHEQRYKNKRLSHVIRQALNPPFLRAKWLN